MRISPRRRQRALKVHELRQHGRSLRAIGNELDISHTTVLSDLKLIETHWSEFAEQSADDFLLEQFGMLQTHLRRLLQRDLLRSLGHLSPADLRSVYHLHNDELGIVLRETRRICALLHERADARQLDPDQIPQDLDYPIDELTAAEKPARLAGSGNAKSKKTPSNKPRTNRSRSPRETTTHHGLPKLSKPNHSNRPIPSKTLKIPALARQEKNSDQPANQPRTDLTPEQLQKEAETFLQNQRKQLQTAAAGA